MGLDTALQSLAQTTSGCIALTICCSVRKLAVVDCSSVNFCKLSNCYGSSAIVETNCKKYLCVGWFYSVSCRDEGEGGGGEQSIPYRRQ